MKRLFVILLALLMLCGCSEKSEGKKTESKSNDKITSDPCEFLTNAEWEGNDPYCINHIGFGEDGSFSNWCACGSPVGAGDITEEYSYNAEKNTVSLYCDGELYETGKILFADNMYLVIDVWERVYVYENINGFLPEVNEIALEHTGIDELTKPCLTVLDYENNTLTVSSYDCDRDAANNFTEWKLTASKDIAFKSISVTVENDVPQMEVYELAEEDRQYIGEHYTSGYLEIDEEGIVQSIVFYGELIIHK